ncbi:polysaccharide biosynthesis protein [Prauserella sp. PE36]|uniref:Polysaccharide biosynthesis protein n=1 Tax=Prauserella endophytica TaxID=1592324 RepID=A0ABY2SE26_9PSEU|nr:MULTISPECIES: Wzz/FepE/Etk N-terminal domain-containing protein [Prauserella]PXY17071.1 polysaccharide biosynthesis protein [Prauserella coralliicola]RBM21312.1 polysaccharide biosynthesis protein [Prauserella sp. PE36]TKG73721.1 polysaccharide biosynthesis protein [Prauserella endophytica]
MTATENTQTAQPLLDLQRLGMTVRRRRRFWLSLGLLGFVLGAALAVLMPPPPSAATRLLVVHEADTPTDSGTLVATDVALLETTRVAEETLRRLGANESPEAFLKTYQGTPVTNNIMEISVQAASEDEAMRRAQALADTFIADYRERVRTAADAEAQALIDQRDRAQGDLDQVNGTVAELTASGDASAAAHLETLYARRAELESQISQLNEEAEQARIGAPGVLAGTQIVDAPRPVTASLVAAVGMNALIGLAFGLAAGLGLTAVLSVVRERPVLRREVAEDLGASVIAELPPPHRGPAKLWRHSRTVQDRKRVAGTLARLVREDSEPVSVLELGCPETAAALALDLAMDLAADGKVVLIDDLPGGRLGDLAGDGPHPYRIVDAADLPLPVWPEELHVGVGSVSPGTAWTDLARLGTETVLVVKAGHATSLWLHTVARQLADARIPIIGVVLVGPDPKDRSDGTLWDGLHTALRGRAGRELPAARAERAIPARATGQETEVFGPVQPENGLSHVDDLPTKRFAPVRPKDAEVS